MPIIYQKTKRDGLLHSEEEISLYEFLNLKDKTSGQLEEIFCTLVWTVDIIEKYLESTPNGKDFLKNYIEHSYVNNVRYEDNDSK